MIEMSKERTTRRGRLLTTNHRDGRATYRLWHAKAHVAFLSLLYIIRLYSRINELVFIFVSHLLGQVVQTLVVLRLRDRAVFMEGLQGGHLPVVESPALFLRGQSLPRRLVRCVHRASARTDIIIINLQTVQKNYLKNQCFQRIYLEGCRFKSLVLS